MVFMFKVIKKVKTLSWIGFIILYIHSSLCTSKMYNRINSAFDICAHNRLSDRIQGIRINLEESSSNDRSVDEYNSNEAEYMSTNSYSPEEIPLILKDEPCRHKDISYVSKRHNGCMDMNEEEIVDEIECSSSLSTNDSSSSNHYNSRVSKSKLSSRSINTCRDHIPSKTTRSVFNINRPDITRNTRTQRKQNKRSSSNTQKSNTVYVGYDIPTNRQERRNIFVPLTHITESNNNTITLSIGIDDIYSTLGLLAGMYPSALERNPNALKTIIYFTFDAGYHYANDNIIFKFDVFTDLKIESITYYTKDNMVSLGVSISSIYNYLMNVLSWGYDIPKADEILPGYNLQNQKIQMKITLVKQYIILNAMSLENSVVSADNNLLLDPFAATMDSSAHLGSNTIRLLKKNDGFDQNGFRIQLHSVYQPINLCNYNISNVNILYKYAMYLFEALRQISKECSKEKILQHKVSLLKGNSKTEETIYTAETLAGFSNKYNGDVLDSLLDTFGRNLLLSETDTDEDTAGSKKITNAQTTVDVYSIFFQGFNKNRSSYSNQNKLEKLLSLLEIVDDVLTKESAQILSHTSPQVDTDLANRYSHCSLSINHVLKYGILYAIRGNEDADVLIMSIYYYLTYVVPNSFDLLFTNREVVSCIFSLVDDKMIKNMDKQYLIESIATSPAMNELFRRIVLGCFCNLEYAKQMCSVSDSSMMNPFGKYPICQQEESIHSFGIAMANKEADKLCINDKEIVLCECIADIYRKYDIAGVKQVKKDLSPVAKLKKGKTPMNKPAPRATPPPASSSVSYRTWLSVGSITVAGLSLLASVTYVLVL
ncbi:hypothetical protein NEOKW01_1870 [Nematocida sp. AWRm80]|nr:hypothetical protein NEOKW01_1870 [Nematocida sp. AWRm80]